MERCPDVTVLSGMKGEKEWLVMIEVERQADRQKLVEPFYSLFTIYDK